VLAPQLEDAIGEVPMDPTGAPVRTAGLLTESFHPFLSVPLTPAPQCSPGDPEDLADLRGPNAALQVLLDHL
jgi:hypothetical protein